MRTTWSWRRRLAHFLILAACLLVREGLADTPNAKAAFGWRFEYDEAGLISAVTDHAGRRTRLTYDRDAKERLRRLTVEQPLGDTVRYEFDEFGQRTLMADAEGLVHYVYDGHGRLISVRRERFWPIAYTYDSDDRIKSVRIGERFILGYTYDFLGRLSEVATPAGPIRYEYLTGENAIRRTLPNGIGTQWDFQPEGRLEKITHFDGDLRIFAELSYRYRADGRIVWYRHASSEGEREARFEYDTSQRLVSADDSRYGRTDYEYDALGNRVAVRRAGRAAIRSRYDWAGRLVEHDGRPVRHDAAGNLTGHPNGRSYEYDAADRLTLVRSEHREVRYRHDGDGALIERSVGGKVTQFVPDPLADVWRPLAILRSDGGATFLVWEGDKPLMEWDGRSARFFLHDHLGTIGAVADGSGAIVHRQDFGPFGEVLAPLVENRLQPGFAGLIYDADAGAYLTRARGYDPSLGRFLQPDPEVRVPTGAQDGLSAYTYAGCDPINCFDSNGRASTCFGDLVWDPDYSQPIGSFLSHSPEGQDPISDFRESISKELLKSLAKKLSPEQVEIVAKIAYEHFEQLKLYYSARLGGQFHQFYYMEQLHRYVSVEFLAIVPFRKYVENTLKIISAMDLAASIPDIINRNQTQRGDLATVGHNTVFALGALKILGLPVPIGFKAMAKLGVDIGEGIRSRALHERTLGLVRLPMGERIRPQVSGRMGSHYGGFEMSSADRRFSARGGWILDHGIRFPTDARRSGARYAGWAHSELNRYRLASGARFTGDIRSTLRQYESGDSTYRITNRLVRGRETFSGRDANRAIREGLTREKQRARPRQDDDSQSLGDLGGPNGDDSGSGGGCVGPGCGGCVGPGCGPGGLPPGGPWGPGGGGGFRGGSPMTPANVGGIYLGGAGEALAGLGSLAGVAHDTETGRLVLLTEEAGEVELRPFPIDELVTVFRNVYRSGGAPSVSIDPDRDDPKGPWMKVRHGEGTEATRVGWVLFEADRIMKAYRLGCDNVTQQPVSSKVDGYSTDFGRGTATEEGSIWTRFWIVPAKVDRRQSAAGDLTLLDVPLRVDTQRMEMKNGELIPAEDPEPTADARGFADWFTEHYGDIAREALAAEPGTSAGDPPIPVLSELQRIAQVSAVAEALRDQGVPLPSWMGSHVVEPLTFDGETPAIVVTQPAAGGPLKCVRAPDRTEMTGPGWRIYGGVRLAPEDKAVHTEASAPEATELSATLIPAVRAAPALTPVSVESANTTYRAVAVPGQDFRDVGALVLDETDLVVPVQRDATISLVRRYHSFFRPNGSFGRGWAVDLPRLEEQRVPVRRDGDEAVTKPGFQLTSPLGTWSARFTERRFVAEANGKLLVPQETGPILGLANSQDARIGQPTHDVLFRDGRRWSFDADGLLVAQEQVPLMVIYRRDNGGRILRIEGWYGEYLRADIRLEYDGQGRIAKAKGSSGDETNYVYDGAGALSRVSTGSNTFSYRYQDGLLAAIAANGEDLRRLEYDSHGRLVSRWVAGAGGTERYEVATGPNGTTVSRRDGNTGATLETAEYDTEIRPRRWSGADGSEISWNHGDDASEARLRTAAGDVHTVTVKRDGSEAVWLRPGGRQYKMRYDLGGRLTEVRKDDRPILTQAWAPDGRLVAVEDETTAVLPQYGADGVVESLIVTVPGAGERLDRWLDVKLDPQGRPIAVSDYGGGDLRIAYDESGSPAVIASAGQGVEVKRDDAGRVRSLETSWGYRERYAYEADEPAPKSIEISAPGGNAEIELDRGRPVRLRQFDGGTWRLTYGTEASAGALRRIETPAGLSLDYDSGTDGRLRGVTIGDRYRQELTYDEAGRVSAFALRPVER